MIYLALYLCGGAFVAFTGIDALESYIESGGKHHAVYAIFNMGLTISYVVMISSEYIQQFPG